ncbi:MAG: YjgP/YjgQ family permease [Bacteroidetes bacterium]|nr:MAG: YjgP/YjgQ family permease [Bacteroidota bacterium]
MLKTLDQYLIRKYLSTFLFSLLIFTLISMAIDFSDKVKNFIESTCTLKEILVDYFLGFILNMGGLLLPLYVMISVIFFTSRMAFNSEILSILNAGVSFNRLLRPYLLAAGAVAVIHLFLNHFLIPVTNKARLNFERQYVWTNQEKGKKANVHFLVGPGVKVYIQGYDKNRETATGLRLEKFEGNRLISLLDAKSAEWKEDSRRWELRNYSIRTFDGLRETYQRFNEPMDTAINLVPQDFIWYRNQNEEMTTAELRAAIARDRSRGQLTSRSYEIEMHRRTADPFTIIILTIIGLAVAGRKVRGGMGLHLAIGMGMGALYILMSKFSISFAASGSVPPALGMWIPNIIFTGVAFWLISRAQK